MQWASFTRYCLSSFGLRIPTGFLLVFLLITSNSGQAYYSVGYTPPVAYTGEITHNDPSTSCVGLGLCLKTDRSNVPLLPGSQELTNYFALIKPGDRMFGTGLRIDMDRVWVLSIDQFIPKDLPSSTWVGKAKRTNNLWQDVKLTFSDEQTLVWNRVSHSYIISADPTGGSRWLMKMTPFREDFSRQTQWNLEITGSQLKLYSLQDYDNAGNPLVLVRK